MTADWVQRDALVTVKAYPNPSAKYHETVCVAAITKEEGWVRLYPVQIRSLPANQRFQKYQRVRLRMKKHDRDARPESYRPDESSYQLLEVIDPKRVAERREWIEPTASESMCAIQKAQSETGKSLGVFRPKEVVDFLIVDGSPDWSGRKQAALDQLTLFDERTTQLEKIPFVFKYKYVCAEEKCKGHTQSIIDWELMELYRNVRDEASSTQEIKAKVRAKYLDQLCGNKRDTYFFVGNHSRFPNTFMVIGVFWPPKPTDKDRQKALF
jgi:hypothetical protein